MKALDVFINIIGILAFPIIVGIVALLIASVYYFVKVIKEPLQAERELAHRPVGSISREEATLSIGRIAQAARSICGLAFGFGVVGLVFYALVFILELAGVFEAGFLWSSFERENLNAVSELIKLCMELYLFTQLKKFFGAIGESARPFELERARELAQAGKTLLYMGYIPNLVGYFINLAVYAAAGPDSAQTLATAAIIDGNCLVLGLCVYLLARVFEYGCILQHEDDGLV